MTESTVCVVTVTYGDRMRFLEQVVNRVLSFKQVVKVVVINNASVYPVTFADERIIVIDNEENEGSAGGYNQGIDHAFSNVECDLIWLLDDDNQPEKGSLENLLLQWDAISAANNKKALFCLRNDRAVQLKIAKGQDPARYFLVPNNFLGFHVFRIFYNQYQKLKDKLGPGEKLKERVAMPYVPYGGLLLHKDMIADIGLPDKRLFLYVDDSEYSYRITQNDGIIWLIPASKVVDVDRSVALNYDKKMLRSQLLDQWGFRNYYHVRNRVYFYSRVAITNNFVFNLNKVLYLAFLQIISVLSAKQTAYKQLLIAVNDGLKGNLGKANPEKF